MSYFKRTCLMGLLSASATLPVANALMQFQQLTSLSLVQKFMAEDGDVEFQNIKVPPTGMSDKCMRYFTGGETLGNEPGTGTPVLFDSGIMLTSGLPSDFNGNNNDFTTFSHSVNGVVYTDTQLREYVWASDPALKINNIGVYDACFLEFEFRCVGDGYVPEVSFKYVFGSEEYYEYVNSFFNDAFALFLNNQNIAKIPYSESTSDIVSINNVNYEKNTDFFRGNDPGYTSGYQPDPVGVPLNLTYPLIEADGFTTVLTAQGVPYTDPSKWNKIKIVVGDVGDTLLDSWVLLEAGTFSCRDITMAPSISLSPSSSPTTQPSVSHEPTTEPSLQPSVSSMPSGTPSSSPTLSSMPSGAPSVIPTISTVPSIAPTDAPSVSSQPSAIPSDKPSVSSMPSGSPTDAPSVSSMPSGSPTDAPSVSSMPTGTPSDKPSVSSMPSGSPTDAPSVSSMPTGTPSDNPSISSMPSDSPTDAPSVSSVPTGAPSDKPSISSMPSGSPTDAPSVSSMPSGSPTDAPSVSSMPTDAPSDKPSVSSMPSGSPTDVPSLSSMPTGAPSDSPSESSKPTVMHSSAPSVSSKPTVMHSDVPSVTMTPSSSPSDSPSVSTMPTDAPSDKPSVSSMPSGSPTSAPSVSSMPTGAPSDKPSVSSTPSSAPTQVTESPSVSSMPTGAPSDKPSVSSMPTGAPSDKPSVSSMPSNSPSDSPSKSSMPSSSPSDSPTVSSMPTGEPSAAPSVSTEPSASPSDVPSSQPSIEPTQTHSEVPSAVPSLLPSESPTISTMPSNSPSDAPSTSSKPTVTGSMAPSISSAPSSAPTQLARIGPNRVWGDQNGNGLQDEGEEGIPEIIVCLFNVTGHQITNTTTDENGDYNFEDVPPGYYYVEVQNPDGWEFSPVVDGGNQIQSSDSIESGYGWSPVTQLELGMTEDTWDAGMYQPVTIGNKVWDDSNGNGYQDADEPGMPNITAILMHADGEEVSRTDTDADGFYRFEGLPPGNYAVQFDIPESFSFLPPANIASDFIVPEDAGLLFGDMTADVNSETGVTATVEVLSGETDLSFDAAIYVPVDVSGTVWDDLDADGIYDSGEPGVDGATLTLYDSDDQPMDVQVTGLDGTFSFPNLPPGEYYTKLSPPPDYLFSANTGNSTYDPNTGLSAPVFLRSGTSGQGSFDAGIYQMASVGDFIWEDQDPDGIQGGGEVGFTGLVTVNLIDSSGTTVQTTTTTNGSYKFDGVTPGDYKLEFILPEGKAFSTMHASGGDSNNDSNIDPQTNRAQVTLISGEYNDSVDGGVSTLGSVAPSPVFDDLNANGIQDDGEPGLPGITVILRNAYGEPVQETQTDSDGLYSFDLIEPGFYYVEVQTEPEYLYSDIVDSGNQMTPANNTGFGESPTVEFVPGTVVDDWIAAVYQPVSIGNRVWNDLDGDGLQDSSEPGMPDVTAILVDGSGIELMEMNTDEDGYYLFDELTPGNYAVKFNIPEEYIFTPLAKPFYSITSPADGSLAYEDVTSDVNDVTGSHESGVSGITETVTLISGDVNLSFDAGIFIPVTISGTTWHDLNANGMKDPDEPGLEGVTVLLFDRDDDPIGGSFTTTEDGRYIFEDLPPGTYTSKVSPPPDYLLSPRGENNSTDNNFDPETMMTSPLLLLSGESGEGSFDAGFYLPASVGNFIWLDETPNGIQDPDEGAFDGEVTIRIYDSLGYKVGEMSPGTSGFYEFTGLMPGDYELEVEVEEDYLVTLQFAGNNTEVDNNFNPGSNKAQITLTSGEVNHSVDAGIMDQAPYYPDWTNDIQVCTNDGFDPAWLEIQKVNYLYKNKEACCKQHFWWRMTQCMANEEYKFYKNGDICDTKIFFEDWEQNSPADWTDTTQFDTLVECCANLFWFDYDGCMQRSPVMFKFDFCVDVEKLVDPPDCQSADIYANVLEDTVNSMLGSDGLVGVDGFDSNITQIGGVFLTKVDGSTICGGSLEGQSFTNENTGKIPDILAAANSTSSICGVITVEEEECAQEDCLREIYSNITSYITSYVNEGRFDKTLLRLATSRLPPVPELQVVKAVNNTVTTSNLLLPGSITGELDLKFFKYNDPATCNEKAFFKPTEVSYETLYSCCQQEYSFDVEKCCLYGGGCPEINVAGFDEGVPRYYATWETGKLCDTKLEFDSWEKSFATLEACCNEWFSGNDACLNPTDLTITP